MNRNSILLTGIIILFLIFATAPAYAVMPSKTGDGVSRGDYDTLAIYEAKDTWKKSESGEYATPWVSIAPGSDIACNGGRSLAYRYRLLTPGGLNYNKVVYDSTYDAGNGLLLSGNAFAFIKDKAANWMRVSTLISNANNKGFAWPGTWTQEFYFGDFDCKKYEYTGWTLVGTKTFTLVDDSASTTTAPYIPGYVTTTTQPTTTPYNYGYVTPTSQQTTTVSSSSWPAVVDYGIVSYDPVNKKVLEKKTSWTSADKDKTIAIWVQYPANTADRYRYEYELLNPDGSVFTAKQDVWMTTSGQPSYPWTQPVSYMLLGQKGTYTVNLWQYDTTTKAEKKIDSVQFTLSDGTSQIVKTTTTPPKPGVTPVCTPLACPSGTHEAVCHISDNCPCGSMCVALGALPSLSACSGTGTSVYTEDRTMQQGKTVTIPVMICNANDLTNMDMTISYDTSVLSFTGATKGSLNSNSYFDSNEPSKGTVKIAFAGSGFSGSGSIALLTFNVVGSTGSTSPIKISITAASTSSGQSLTIPVTNGNFVVGIPKPGDTDGDNQVTGRDALAALQMSVGKRTMNLSMDVTGDGTVNSMDAQKILLMIVKKA